MATYDDASTGGSNFTSGTGFQYLTTTTDNLVVGGTANVNTFDGQAAKIVAVGSSSRFGLMQPNGAAGGCFWEFKDGSGGLFGGVYSGHGYIGTTGATNVNLRTNNTDRGMVRAAGGFDLGVGSMATTATNGYVFIPSCAGAPTGVPANITSGMVAFHYDRTGKKIYVYDGGWISTAALT